MHIESSNSWFIHEIERPTDWNLKKLLEIDYKKSIKPTIQSVNSGDIKLEVKLELEYNEMFISGKVGNKKMYVIKDWHEFVENIKETNP